MNTLCALMVGFLAMLPVWQLGTPEEYAPEDVPHLVSDFELQYELRSQAGQPITNSVVDAIAVVRVVAPEGISGPHDLVMYRDGRFVGSQTDVVFPFESKWNFKSLLGGTHAIVLVFTNAEGNKGIVRFNVTVQHS
jgi:hypothetical protein